MIKITDKIKQRLINLEQGITNLKREQVEIVNIFLESRGEDLPEGSTWSLDETGDHIIIQTTEENATD
jgi:hypothetical protein